MTTGREGFPSTEFEGGSIFSLKMTENLEFLVSCLESIEFGLNGLGFELGFCVFYAGSRPGFLKLVSCGVAEWCILVFANGKKPKIFVAQNRFFNLS